MNKSHYPVMKELLSYLGAVVAIGVAAIARWDLIAAFGQMPPFITFFPALLVVAMLLGWRAGVVATFLSSFVAAYWYMAPFGAMDPANMVAFALYTGASLLLCALVYALERSRGKEAKANQRLGAETERETALEFLHLINESGGTKQLVEAAVRFFREQSGCEAVGIRLKAGDDYPYYEAHGFPEEFVLAENSLCVRDPEGRIQRDSAGNPTIACMCGNVICGRFDPSKPFFTAAGSFWTNSTTELLANTTDGDRQAKTRNRCHGQGYESVALIAMPIGDQRLGLLQLNDRRKGMFSLETLTLWERLAGYLAVALAKTMAEEDLAAHHEWLRVTLTSIGDAVLATDGEGRITSLNPVGAALTGWHEDEAVGQPAQTVFNIVNEQTREPGEDIVARVLREGSTVLLANHTALLTRDGREIPIEDSAAPIKDAEGNLAGVVLVFHDVTEKRRARDRLRESERQYRELVQNANSAIIRWKRDGAITFFNEYAQTLFGYTADEITGKHVSTLVPEQESTGGDLRGLVQDVLEHPERYTHNENENICRDGRRVWMTWANKPIFDENGQVAEVLAVGSDITERRRAEEQTQSVAFFPEENPFPVLRVNNDGILLYVNRSAASLLDQWECSVGRKVPELIRQVVNAVAANGTQQEIEIRVKGRDLSLVAVLIAERGYVNLYGRDITERKQAEDAVRESEERFRTMADAMPQLAWIAHADGYIFWYNQRWYEYTGTTPEQMEGWGWKRVHDPEALPKVVERWQASLATGEPFDMEFPLRGADGHLRPFLTRVLPLKDEQGRIVQWLGTNTDITERKRAEEQLRESEENLKRLVDNLARSNRDLQHFAYVASHDLQEPLRQITAFVQLLDSQAKDHLDETSKEYMGFVVEGTKRMHALVLDLLAYSRVDSAARKLEPVPVHSAVEEALHNLNLAIEESQATITCDELPTVNADKAQLVQVFQNLIGNAIKFRGEPTPAVHVGVERKDGEWLFSVRDNGIGFDPQHAEKIFQLFQRLHNRENYPGTGIGLTICKRVIERHGGRIWTQSEPGKGATFCFTIPMTGA